MPSSRRLTVRGTSPWCPAGAQQVYGQAARLLSCQLAGRVDSMCAAITMLLQTQSECYKPLRVHLSRHCHPVLYSAVSGCHYRPADAAEGLSLYESEQTLALLNEYLVKVGASSTHTGC